MDGGQPDIKAIGIGDLSAGCKFTASTYGMIIGIYRAIPQLDYAHVGIDLGRIGVVWFSANARTDKVLG